VENYPHKVWVGSGQIGGDSGWRYANVKKTVAYIIVDEDEGGPVLERWFLKSNQQYFNKEVVEINLSMMAHLANSNS